MTGPPSDNTPEVEEPGAGAKPSAYLAAFREGYRHATLEALAAQWGPDVDYAALHDADVSLEPVPIGGSGKLLPLFGFPEGWEKATARELDDVLVGAGIVQFFRPATTSDPGEGYEFIDLPAIEGPQPFVLVDASDPHVRKWCWAELR